MSTYKPKFLPHQSVGVIPVPFSGGQVYNRAHCLSSSSSPLKCKCTHGAATHCHSVQQQLRANNPKILFKLETKSPPHPASNIHFPLITMHHTLCALNNVLFVCIYACIELIC